MNMKKSNIVITFALLVCGVAIAHNAASQRKFMEDAFISRMKAMAEGDFITKTSPDSTVLSKVEGKDYYICPGDTYIYDEISSATYYAHKGTSFQPLCDKRFPIETISNRLLLSDSGLPGGEMKLTFHKYRYETDSLNIQFKEFIAFCNSENYKAYVGIEQIDSIELKVDVFLCDNIGKWLHIFNFSSPVEEVADEGLSITGNAWLFVPTSNIRELMGKELPDDFMKKLVRGTKK